MDMVGRGRENWGEVETHSWAAGSMLQWKIVGGNVKRQENCSG